MNIFEDGMENRDFVYIDNVVDATILGIEKKEADDEIFNVGAEKNISILKVISMLKDAYKLDVNIRLVAITKWVILDIIMQI